MVSTARVPEVVLHVTHAGQPKMVGKVLKLDLTGDGERVPCFVHETHKGTQAHRRLNSPAGVDNAVLAWLRKAGVSHVLVYDTAADTTYAADLDAFDILGVVQVAGGRTRTYLSYGAWERHDGAWPSVTALRRWVTARKVLES